MTTTQVVETSVTKDYLHMDDHAKKNNWYPWVQTIYHDKEMYSVLNFVVNQSVSGFSTILQISLFRKNKLSFTLFSETGISAWPYASYFWHASLHCLHGQGHIGVQG